MSEENNTELMAEAPREITGYFIDYKYDLFFLVDQDDNGAGLDLSFIRALASECQKEGEDINEFFAELKGVYEYVTMSDCREVFPGLDLVQIESFDDIQTNLIQSGEHDDTR